MQDSQHLYSAYFEQAMDAWKDVLRTILLHGTSLEVSGKPCRELLTVSVVVRNTAQLDRPVHWLKRQKKWVYPSRNELLAPFFSKKDVPFYKYTYGSRIFDFRGVDQIEDRIVPLLKEDATSRRASVVFLDPKKDVLTVETPSLTSVHFFVRDRKLHVTGVFRSTDYFLGWPANIVQLHALQEFVAKKLSVRVGEITMISLSAHVYSECIEDVERLVL